VHEPAPNEIRRLSLLVRSKQSPEHGFLAAETSFENVLDSAKTGLNFTRSQDQIQLDGLTQIGQTKQGIRYHVPPCCVPVGMLA